MATDYDILEKRAKLSDKKQALLDKLLRGRTGSSAQRPTIPRRPQYTIAPLSFAQQRLWFLNKLDPGSSAYNVPYALRLTGRLNLPNLERSLQEIISRHEVLRTTFPLCEGEPVQAIARRLDWSLPVIDLTQLPEPAREVEADRLMYEDSCRRFNLGAGPIFRTTLLRLRDDLHILLIIFHHIVCDEWSFGVLEKELVTLYGSFANNRPSSLSELPIQYADFAIWQRQWMQGEVLNNQLSYWEKKLANAPALLELPTDRPRPAVQSFHGAGISRVLSEALCQSLKRLSQKNDATMFMTLLAAFKVLLFRYTGQEDILVGTPIANRNHIETEGLIGFFLNTLVLRTNLSGNQSFVEILRDVRDVALQAYENQELPFDRIVEKLQPERRLSHNPLFQVLFVLLSAKSESKQFSGLTMTHVPIQDQTSKFDLALFASETEHGLSVSFRYSIDLFGQASIARMLEHFEALLEGISTKPDRRVSDLSLLPEAERTQLIQEWNDTWTEVPQNLGLHQLFEAQVRRTPEAVAVTFENQQVTYRHLNQRANQLAHHLQTQGVGPETLIGICVERSLEMVIGILGVLKSGAAYVPLDSEYPKERVSFMLQDSRCEILLTQEKLRETLPSYPGKVICLEQFDARAGAEDKPNLSVSVRADNLAYCIYTSGSTGRPKGVMVSHQAICNHLLWRQKIFPLTPHDAFLQKASLSFDISVWEIFAPLVSGARLVLALSGGQRDSGYLVRLIAKEEITIAHFGPPMLQIILEEPELGSCKRLRQVFCGGDPLPVGLLKRFFDRLPAALCNQYGPTETTVDATFFVCDRVKDHQIVPIGRPIANTQAFVLSSNLELAPTGVGGELCIAGQSLARGYLNRADLTAEKFIPNPFSSEPGARLYRTGDLVRYSVDGLIEFKGRIDHQVKLRGFRIELGEIEAVLACCPEVQDTLVIVREDVPGEKQLVAYVIPAEGHEVSSKELSDFLKQKLPSYMVPSAFVLLSAFPLTASGKINRRELPAPEQRTDILEIMLPPRNPVEEVLAGIWAAVLRLEKVGVHENFFEIGGHSLLATQVISRAREAFKIDLPLRTLFEAPTIDGLGKAIEVERRSHMAVVLPSIEPVARDGELALSFAQQRLWFIDQLEPNSSVYNLSYAVRLAGPLHFVALNGSLNEIVRRHEILRTTFPALNGHPVQRIEPVQTLGLSLIDLRALGEMEREDKVRQFLRDESQKPFNLQTWPLIRASLLQLSDAEHLLLLVMHHIVSDGWTMGILFAELNALYEAFSLGNPSPLMEPRLQYADFAQWQRLWLRGETLEKQLAYWKEQLAGVPALLELPTDHRRPGKRNLRGATYKLKISKELTNALGQLSRQENATLFMTMLAAFQTLLHRYTNQEHIVVGSPIAGRNYIETEGLIGFFVNTLALRTSFSGNSPFRQVLKQVRETALGAYTHQDLPFEKLVEELKPERSLNYTPLFQTIFTQQYTSNQELRLLNLTLTAVQIEMETVKFDLGFEFTDGPEGIAGTFHYATDLFEASTIRRMAGHLQVLLNGIVADPQQGVSELALLSKDEHRELLEWNDTRMPESSDSRLHELFEAQVHQTPDSIALTFEKQQLTYRELDRRAEQVADHLQKLGVRPEVIVGIFMERSLEMVIGLLGILKAGGAYLPLDPSYPEERLAWMLEDSRTAVLLTQKNLLSKLPPHKARPICLDADTELFSKQCQPGLKSDVQSHNVAYVIYTSGSTGRPKGVMISHRAICNHMRWMQRVFPLSRSDSVLQKTPFSFDASVWEFHAPLMSGAQLIMALPGGHQNPSYLIKAIIESRITILQLVPTLLNVLLQEPGFEQCKSLRRVFCGGEALTLELQERFFRLLPQATLHNLYGPTEAAIDSTAWTCLPETPLRTVPIGRPIDNAEAYIVDALLELVPVGVPGELLLGGAGLAEGYLNHTELTAERFIPHPFCNQPGSRLYRTGDMCRRLADGNIEYLARIDHQVKIRGFRIESGEIEAVLSSCPGVQKTLVVVSQDVTGEKQLVAYVIPAMGHEVSVEDLRDFLKRKLPSYMVPSAFIPLATFPLTPSGKIDRRRLPAADRNRIDSNKQIVAPRTPMEEVLTEVWSKVLGIEQVSIHDDFFAIGGHSLLAIQLFSKLRAILHAEVPVRLLFEAPTIAELARLIDEENRRKTSSVQPARSHWAYLTPIQALGAKHPFYFLPGGLGSEEEFLVYARMARYLGFDQPFYGLKARGLDGKEKPHSSVLEMSAAYLEEIKAFQPCGPYSLVGECAGGLVAFEMARQLHAQGASVALVALLDCQCPRRTESLQHTITKLKIVLRKQFLVRALYHLRRLPRIASDERVPYFYRQAEKAKHRITSALGLTEKEQKQPASESRFRDPRFDAYFQTLIRYRPKPYGGKLTLLVNEDLYRSCPALGWTEFARGGLEVHQLPGNHTTYIRQHVQSAAEKVKECLEKARS